MSELLELYPCLASDSAIDQQNKLRRLVRENTIPFLKVDGKILFPLEIIYLWLEGLRYEPPATKLYRVIQT